MKQLLSIISILYSLCCTYTSLANTFPLSKKAVPNIIVEKKALHAGTNTLGLHFIIQEGWHLYWKNPGDTGLAPEVVWKKQDGIKISSFKWPYPERINIGSTANYGYKKELLLPFSVTISNSFSGKKLALRGMASWLVCKDSCIKEETPIGIDIPISNKASFDAESKYKFDKVKKQIPKKISEAFFSIRRNEKEIQLHLDKNFLKTYGEEVKEVFPGSKFIKNNIYPRIDATESGISIKFSTAESLKKDDFFSSVIIVKVKEQLKSFEIAGEIKESPFIPVTRPSKIKEAAGLLSIIKYMFFAFLGGLILNLMPCVFPILSLKIFSFLSHKEERSYISGIFYTLGVLSFFLVIGIIFTFFRSKGVAIGWGFQLQSPYFILFLIILFFVISLNLLGLFDFSSRLSSWGHRFTHGDTMLASFFTGGLAVLVATPCSAPFMAVAIGFSLTQSSFISILVFSSLALGLAMPYALLSFFPGFFSFLPKPGKWMLVLKEFLAFPLLLTVVWLLWIFDLQKGANSTIYIFCAIIFIYFSFWINKNFNTKIKYFLHFLSLLLIVTSLYFSLSMPSLQKGLSAEPLKSVKNDNWEVFSIEILEKYLSENKKVFVNFTAAWCITCKVNEAAVLNKEEVQATFKKNNIKLLKADWTNENKEILETLRKYGRASIPLYLFFDRSKTPTILPQLLQKNDLLKVITKDN